MRIINYLVNQIILVTCGCKPVSGHHTAHSRRPETHNTATMKRRLSILLALVAATVITALAHTSPVLGNGAVGIDYEYNLRGWNTNVTSNVFSQQIHYHDVSSESEPCFNGNISATEWLQGEAGNQLIKTGGFSYYYDELDRLVAANFRDHSERDFSCQYEYDIQGNATRVSRYGITDRIDAGGTTSCSYGVIDDVTLTYNGNRLVCADDAADALVYDGAMDFHDGANEEEEYDYDANGNLTKDLNKGISRITYDWNNLPREVIFASDATTRYTYDASGRKLQAEYTKINSATEMEISIIPSVPLVETDIIDYQGDNIYRNGALERTLTPNGYIVNDTVYYYVKDYQGNVRSVVREDGAVVESNEYYPYGGLFSATPSAQPYKYGSKELDRTHGLDWYDSKARFYDPLLGRANSIDKKAGDYTWLSPYLWCAANPIKFVDPDGKSPIYDMDGTFLGTDDKGLQGEYLIMSRNVFKQSMKHSDAVSNNYIGAIDPKVRQKIWDHHATLGDRPDWDGKLTLDEANEWYRKGKGEDLYIDIKSIDLSSFRSLGDKYIGKHYYFNLLVYGNPLDGLVYGNLGFERTPNHGVKSLGDKYDFDIKEWSRDNVIRNIETYIGALVAGKGVPYRIIIYGEQKLKKL